MISKTLLALAAILFMAVSAIKLTPNENHMLASVLAEAQEGSSATNLTFHIREANFNAADINMVAAEVVARPVADTSANTAVYQTVDIDWHVVAINGKPKDVWYTIDFITNHTAATPGAAAGSIDLEIHMKSMRLGGGPAVPIDQTYTVDRLTNNTVDPKITDIAGGHCRNVQTGTYSYAQNGITKSGTFQRCMDACDIWPGTVVKKTVGSNTIPTCEITEAACGASWWHADSKSCDVDCSQSGGILAPVDANLPNGEKTCTWNTSTDVCTYPYTPTWTQVAQCDNFCQTNSGTLRADGVCVYSNMTY